MNDANFDRVLDTVRGILETDESSLVAWVHAAWGPEDDAGEPDLRSWRDAAEELVAEWDAEEVEVMSECACGGTWCRRRR